MVYILIVRLRISVYSGSVLGCGQPILVLARCAAMTCDKVVLAGIAEARFIFSNDDYPRIAPAWGCYMDTGNW